jgi:transposase
VPSILAERLADRVDVVIGVDTHTDTHTAAALTPVGNVLAELTVAATAAGAAILLAWADQQTSGFGSGRRVWALDSARSHGVGLLRVLRAAGENALEAPKPATARRRRGGKSDALDAVHAARAVLAADHLATPRVDGDREALRVLHVCRRHYSDTRTATVNLFKSLILTADDELREQFRGRSTIRQLQHAATLIGNTADSILERLRRTQLRVLAEQIHALDRMLKDNLADIRALVQTMCPALLAQPGIGPVTAAIALTAWSHHGRFRSEAAFAALAGVNPVPASSGRTVRHRLNRGGDRTLNAAIHTIAKSRQRCHQPTKDYITRRTAEGRTGICQVK